MEETRKRTEQLEAELGKNVALCNELRTQVAKHISYGILVMAADTGRQAQELGDGGSPLGW